MSKPSILFIPGSFSLPEVYDPVLSAVRSKGYEIKGLHNPSASPKTGPREGAPPTMYDDAANIAKETEKLADEGKDVVLVAHSYGGMPTTESTKGLSKKERAAQGKKGGIIKLAYMTALVPDIGVSAVGVLSTLPEDNKLDLKIDDKGWMYHDDIAASAAIAFSDLPPEEGQAWVKKFVQHSAISFAGELTHAGYKDIPVSYLVCEKDLCIPKEIQRDMIANIEKVAGRKVDITSVETDHVPNTRRPELVSKWILDVVEKV